MTAGRPSRSRVFAIAALSVSLAACGKDAPVGARAIRVDALRLVAGTEQIGLVGTRLAVAPAISVLDSNDQPIAGRRLTARVSQGGGILGGSLVTDRDGIAKLDRWTLGPIEGLNAVEVEVDGLAPLTVYAKAVPVSTFNIEFRFLNAVTEPQRAAFERAAARWRKVIVGDVADFTASRPSACGLENSAIDQPIDDLLIFVVLDSIDGPGEVLGSAGPCSVRSATGIPIVGAMRFDEDDLANMESSGRLDGLVLHEIGHILGLGTLWKYHDLLAGAGGDDPHYLGQSGRAAFLTAGGLMYGGLPVPIENTGEPGTRDSHWRESVLNAEVMTGWIEQPGVRMPLSLLTIGSLEDMGYRVTVWGDDPYSYDSAPLLSGALPRRAALPERELIETPFPPPEVLTASGRSTPISAHIIRSPARERRVPQAVQRPVQQLEVRRER